MLVHTHPPAMTAYSPSENRRREEHQPQTPYTSPHTHRHGSILEKPGRLGVHYQETCAYAPKKKGDHDGNTAEVDRDACHSGDAALGQRGTRARVARRVARRPWVAWRHTRGDRDRHRAILGTVLGAILGGILETLCLWLPLWLPARRHRALYPTLCATLSTGCCPGPSTSILVLLRSSEGLLPLCPTVPRWMASGDANPTIASRQSVPKP